MNTKTFSFLFLGILSIHLGFAVDTAVTSPTTNQPVYVASRVVDFEKFSYQITSPTTVSVRSPIPENTKSSKPTTCIIPEQITVNSVTYRVTGIMKYGISKYTNYEKVVIPKSIIDIQPHAFSCDSLSYIEVDPQNPSFTSIEGLLHSKDCSVLIRLPANHPTRQYKAPDTLESIAVSAFMNCRNLEQVFLSKLSRQTQNIDFQGCKNLESIKVSSENTYFTSIHGILYNKEGSILLHYPANKSGSIFKMPESVIKLNGLSFYGCRNLTEVHCSPNLSTIVSFSFFKCEKLRFILLMNSVRTIANAAFHTCNNLTRIDYGKSPCQISPNQFLSPNLKEIIVDKSNSRYTFFEGVVFNKNKTSVIFYPEGKSDSVYTLPESVWAIGEQCFYNSVHLKKLILPKGLKSIGNNAFLESGIRSIELPESVTNFGNNPFMNCIHLQSITVNWKIPPTIRQNAFFNQFENTKLIVPDSSKALYQKAPFWRLFQNMNGDLFTVNGIHYKETSPNRLSIVRIDSSVKSIEINNELELNGEKFQVTELRSDTLENKTLKRIVLTGNSIFLSAYNLKQFTKLSEIVVTNKKAYQTSVNGVLYNRDSTILIYYPKGKEDSTFAIPSSVTQIGGNAFYQNANLKHLIIPSSFQKIHYRAFFDFIGLESVFIPASVTSIEGNAFNGCINLRHIELPNTLTSIQEYTFSRCRSLKEINLPTSLKAINQSAFWGDNSLTSIAIPDSVTSIGEYAFSTCIQLQSVKLPTTLIQLGEGAFWGCQSLRSVDLPNSVQSMGKNVFSRCYDLTSVKLPNKLTALNRGTFWGCKSLQEVVIPNSVTSIDTATFEGCSNLKRVVLPSSLKRIPFNLFYKCSSLTDIAIPSSVHIIERTAFYACSSLTQIYVPDAVEEIGISAFNNCRNLTQIRLPIHIKHLSNFIFSECINLTSIELPKDLLTIGRSAFSKCYALYDVVLPLGVTDIGQYAFSGCRSLLFIALPPSLNKIEKYTFSGCTKLEHLILPKTLTHIGKYAFNSCSSLEQLSLPDAITNIDSAAFKNCTSITEVILPKLLQVIHQNLFYNCTALKSVTIPSSVTSIEKNAFFMCENIQTIRMLNPKPIQLSGNVFSSISREKCLLLVPKSSIDLYKTTTYWNTFKANIYPL